MCKDELIDRICPVDAITDCCTGEADFGCDGCKLTLENLLNEFSRQIRAAAIDDFVAYANTMPTIEDADGCIRPMSLEEMAEEMKKGKTCSDCIIDKTDACPRGAGRAVDDEICEEFLEEQSKGAGE